MSLLRSSRTCWSPADASVRRQWRARPTRGAVGGLVSSRGAWRASRVGKQVHRRPARGVSMTVDSQAPLTEALGTDFFSVRRRFTQAQWNTFMAVRKFVDHEVSPAAPEAWDAAQMSWDVINRLPALGIVGDDIEGNGCPGLDPLSCGLVAM